MPRFAHAQTSVRPTMEASNDQLVTERAVRNAITDSGLVASIAGTPSDTLDVIKWISTNANGTHNFRWESDIAQGGQFPDQGGIAFLSFGSVEDSNTYSWPRNIPTIEGQEPTAWEYTVGNSGSNADSDQVAPTIIYTGATNISLDESRVDGEIIISTLDSSGAIRPEVIIATAANPQTNQIIYRGQVSADITATGTYSFTSNNLINTTLTNGVPIYVFLQDTQVGNQFTYSIPDVRISYSRVEFNRAGESGTTFTQLTDTPTDYTGQSGRYVAVNSTSNGLEFVAAPTGSGYPTINTPFPTTNQGDIIYFTGDNTGAEGIYRWSGTEYLPGPRVLDFRATAADGVVSTVATDVDSVTFSNAFDVTPQAGVSLNESTLAGYTLTGTPAPGRVAEFASVGNYPTTGGVAIENIGNLAFVPNQLPTNLAATTLTIQGTPGWDVTNPDGTSPDLVFTNNTGSAQSLVNGRLDVDITVTTTPTTRSQTVRMDLVGQNLVLLDAFEVEFEVGVTAVTITATDLTNDAFTSLADGADLTLRFQELEFSSEQETIAFDIDAMRLSFTQDDFVREPDVVTWVDNIAADDSITTNLLADGAVTTIKLADDAVTGPKIANNSVGEGHLQFANGTTELPGRVITYGTGGFSTISSPVPAIAQNTTRIVDKQNRINALTTRIGDLEDEVHNLEASSERITTNFYRTIDFLTSPPSDTLVDYTTVGGTTRNWTLSSTTAGTATFRQGSTVLDSDIDSRTTSHIADIYGHELVGGTYRRTETGGVTSGQISYQGEFITPVGVLRLVTNSGTINYPLRITHDTQGRVYTHLWDPFPVDVDLEYTSYTITYHYVDIGAAGSNVGLNNPTASNSLRVGVTGAQRQTLVAGTSTVFVRYNEPSTNRVVEFQVNSVTQPSGQAAADIGIGFEYVDLALTGRTLGDNVRPPTNTDVTILIDGVVHPDTTHGSITLRSPNGNHTVTLSVDDATGDLVSSAPIQQP